MWLPSAGTYGERGGVAAAVAAAAAAATGQDSYSNHFTCIPADVPFRPGAHHAQAVRPGTPHGHRGGQERRRRLRRRPGGRRRRRRDLGRQVGPGAGPVSVGPEEGDLLLGARFAGLGRPGLGHDQHPPRRPGGAGQLFGRRPGPAHHYWTRVQRRAGCPLRFARQRDADHVPHIELHGRRNRRITTSSASRTRRAASRCSCAEKRTTTPAS